MNFIARSYERCNFRPRSRVFNSEAESSRREQHTGSRNSSTNVAATLIHQNYVIEDPPPPPRRQRSFMSVWVIFIVSERIEVTYLVRFCTTVLPSAPTGSAAPCIHPSTRIGNCT
ncbi:uncharacterized protein [Physcomitrium patens]|uniref:Uncharacterized protein n=1 Tax=Physcomitrium patens TaxID=3218 RepID=A0A2K1JCV9_PHYPA|nr:hypothetical protein PHYPA_019641 [Physcomitrium patens]